MNSSNLLTGILLSILAGCLFAFMDAAGKHLITLIPVLQVMWGRYLCQTVVLSGYLAATTGTGFLRTRHPLLQLIRGLMVLTAGILMYNAFLHVPLADATAVVFFSPIVVTIMSVIFLNESIGVHRISAIVVGFLGLLLILNPNFTEMNTALLYALAASIFNSVFLLLTRRLSIEEEAPSTQFNTTALGTVVLTVLMVPNWQTPDLETAMLLILAGLIGTAGQFILIKALAYAPASLLSPFLYSQVLMASLISVFAFGDPLRPQMILGTAILVVSGIYIWYREHR